MPKLIQTEITTPSGKILTFHDIKNAAGHLGIKAQSLWDMKKSKKEVYIKKVEYKIKFKE